jgi:hypothetical protein
VAEKLTAAIQAAVQQVQRECASSADESTEDPQIFGLGDDGSLEPMTMEEWMRRYAEGERKLRGQTPFPFCTLD